MVKLKNELDLLLEFLRYYKRRLAVICSFIDLLQKWLLRTGFNLQWFLTSECLDVVIESVLHYVLIHCKLHDSLIQLILYKVRLTEMIPKRSFRKKSFKLHTNPDQLKAPQQSHATDFLSSSIYKNRGSADLFSHLKYYEEGSLEFMKSLNTEWGRGNSNTKKVLSDYQDTREQKQNQNRSLERFSGPLQSKKALADKSEIEMNRRVLEQDIEQLSIILDKSKQTYHNLMHIGLLQKTIQEQVKTLQGLCSK